MKVPKKSLSRANCGRLQKPGKLGAKIQDKTRSTSGALYTACFLSLVIPFVIVLGNTVLQAALCNYENARLRFVGNDIVEQCNTLSDLEEQTFADTFTALARANNLPVRNVKVKIAACQDTSEPTTEIKVTGNYARLPALFCGAAGFQQIFLIKDSQLSTYGYLAINTYPYCEFDPTHGLSSYLPLYRPSPAAPTWQFAQDTAIGGVRKAIGNGPNGNDQNPKNWTQLADNLTSIY